VKEELNVIVLLKQYYGVIHWNESIEKAVSTNMGPL